MFPPPMSFKREHVSHDNIRITDLQVVILFYSIFCNTTTKAADSCTRSSPYLLGTTLSHFPRYDIIVVSFPNPRASRLHAPFFRTWAGEASPDGRSPGISSGSPCRPAGFPIRCCRRDAASSCERYRLNCIVVFPFYFPLMR